MFLLEAVKRVGSLFICVWRLKNGFCPLRIVDVILEELLSIGWFGWKMLGIIRDSFVSECRLLSKRAFRNCVAVAPLHCFE